MMVAMLSVGITSCGGDDDNPAEIAVNPSSVSFDADGGFMTIMVSSNTSWTINGIPSWLQVSTVSGKNNQQVMLTASSNTSPDSRSGIFTIVTDGGDASVTVSFTQSGVKIDENDVVNTTWEDNHRYSDGSTYVTSLKFGTTTAKLSETYTEGGTSIANVTDYTYTRTNNIVILTPVEAGKAVMEGRIESGAKMILTNTSDVSQNIVLYKKG